MSKCKQVSRVRLNQVETFDHELTMSWEQMFKKCVNRMTIQCKVVCIFFIFGSYNLTDLSTFSFK